MPELNEEQLALLQLQAAAQLRLREIEEQRKAISFRQFIEMVNPGYEFYDHTERIIGCLQKVADGEIKRLLISIPPRHSKSLTTSQLFPAYMVYRFPEKFVGLCTYGSELTYSFSRAARSYFQEAGGQVNPEASAVHNWGTMSGGGCWAVGVGGPLTGRGAHCFPGDTRVVTEGAKVRIDMLCQMKQKPRVLSYNHQTGKTEWKRVLASCVSPTTELIEVVLGHGHRLRTTPDHPFWVVDEGYVPAGQLKPGQQLLEVFVGYCDTVEVAAICTVKAGLTLVYDIQVEDNANFFAEDVLVHNCAIVDDPLRNSEDADSATIREKQKEWFSSTLYTRLEPNSALIVIQTRWHEDDLTGWLLEQERTGATAEHWHVISYEAIKTDDELRLPPTCTVEPDWREEGKALCPERYDEEALARIRKVQGARFWASLYQQRPAPAEGAMFRRDSWSYYTFAPDRFDRIIASWDLAFKASTNSDYVASVVLGQIEEQFYVLEMINKRLDFVQTLEAIVEQRQRWPTMNCCLVEDAANGPAVLASLKRQIGNLIAVKPQGGKVARAQAITGYVEAGSVHLPADAPWITDWVEHFAFFPFGSHDDMVDALSQGMLYCLHGGSRVGGSRGVFQVY